jgi:hypothetical protein
MSMHIIIDGYNLIRQSHRLSALDRRALQMGREALLDTLAAYKKKASHTITVVFDGVGAPDFVHHRDKIQGINVTYSHQGESADAVIRQMVARKREKALVVSSDREVVQFASANGAATISSPEFEFRVTEALYDDMDPVEGQEETGWRPTTRKKGPSRRLSKKERRNRQKIRKL